MNTTDTGWAKKYLALTNGWRSLADVSHSISPFAVQATMVFFRGIIQHIAKEEYERGRGKEYLRFRVALEKTLGVEQIETVLENLAPLETPSP